MDVVKRKKNVAMFIDKGTLTNVVFDPPLGFLVNSLIRKDSFKKIETSTNEL